MRRRRRSSAGSRPPAEVAATQTGSVQSSRDQAPVSGSRLETQPLVVGVDHARRGQHARESPPPQDVALAPHELTGGEVAVPRGHVVQLHPGHPVAVVAEQHQADRLVATLHQEGRAPLRGPVPDQVGLVLQDVGAVHAHHVSEVLVVRADLEHLEGVLVVPCRDQLADVPEVDQGERDVHRHHRPDGERRVEAGEHDAREQVQHPEAKQACLHHRHDQERRAEPADQVEPGHAREAICERTVGRRCDRPGAWRPRGPTDRANADTRRRVPPVGTCTSSGADPTPPSTRPR